MTRRAFGGVRRLPSGRFQASFHTPDGRRHIAPETFERPADARLWLDRVSKDLRSGRWQDYRLGERTLREYAEEHLGQSANVGERWAETCRRNMRLHMSTLLDLPVVAITGPVVRTWHSTALQGPGGKTSIAQSYRFLRAVMNVALQDGAIAANPCRIPRAGTVDSPERPIATPAEVDALIQASTPRFRITVVLAAWCGLRRGEICALATTDINLTTGTGTVHVRRNWVELLESDAHYEKAPKTSAGRRSVSIPPHVLPIVAEHLEQWAGPVHLVVNADGTRVRGNSIYQAFVRARGRTGLSLSFHDLRHTGQTLAASTGASLADLKRRLGHSSSAAAMRYMHAVDGRDAEIAQALSRLAEDGDGAALPTSRRGNVH